jgi:hypothetical protein
MTPELDAKLCAAFPTLFRDRRGDMRETAMVWGIETGDGWFQLIWDLCEKLEPLCAKAEQELSAEAKKFGYSAAATQVKEKYGTLRFYLNCSNAEMDALIGIAQKKSAVTCETCGKKGRRKDDNGWLRTACKEH